MKERGKVKELGTMFGVIVIYGGFTWAFWDDPIIRWVPLGFIAFMALVGYLNSLGEDKPLNGPRRPDGPA